MLSNMDPKHTHTTKVMSPVTYQISFPEGFFLVLIVFLNRGCFIVHSSLFHVSWQPRNIRRSPSDFFYPKSLIRRTGWSPSLQVGAVSGLRLGATVLGPRLLSLFLPLLLFPHNFRAPAEADAFLTPRSASHILIRAVFFSGQCFHLEQ